MLPQVSPAQVRAANIASLSPAGSEAILSVSSMPPCHQPADPATQQTSGSDGSHIRMFQMLSNTAISVVRSGPACTHGSYSQYRMCTHVLVDLGPGTQVRLGAGHSGLLGATASLEACSFGYRFNAISLRVTSFARMCLHGMAVLSAWHPVPEGPSKNARPGKDHAY